MMVEKRQPRLLSSWREIEKVAQLPGINKLRCPRCYSHRLRLAEAAYCCEECSLQYSIDFSCIPNFLLPELNRDVDIQISPENPAPDYKNHEEQKIFQRVSHDNWEPTPDDFEYEFNRPDQNRLLGYLVFQRIEYAFRNIEVEGKEAVVVCAGFGLDSEWLSQRGAKVTAVDISPRMALALVDRYAYRKVPEPVTSIAADAENLPLKDDSFDYAICYEGLHHLPNPIKGVLEMCRVARKAAIFVEPTESLLLPIARILGRGKQREWCGNIVYRLTPRELFENLDPAEWRLLITKVFKLEKHHPGRLMRFFSLPALFQSAKLGITVMNSAFPFLGTQLVVQIHRVD